MARVKIKRYNFDVTPHDETGAKSSDTATDKLCPNSISLSDKTPSTRDVSDRLEN